MIVFGDDEVLAEQVDLGVGGPTTRALDEAPDRPVVKPDRFTRRSYRPFTPSWAPIGDLGPWSWIAGDCGHGPKLEPSASVDPCSGRGRRRAAGSRQGSTTTIGAPRLPMSRRAMEPVMRWRALVDRPTTRRSALSALAIRRSSFAVSPR